jgi:DNA-binding response OmpR family regulator
MVEQATFVNVLALLPSADDQSSLRHIFQHSRWNLHLTETLLDGRRMVDDVAAGVVITARHLPDASWKDVLQELQSRSAPLIVTDRLADDRLWAEVLNLGGYDLLTTPFQPEEVRRSVSLAWRHWRDSRLRGMESAA